MKYFKGKAIGPVYTPLTQLDFAPEIARIRAEKPDAVFAFLVGAGGVAFSKQYAQAGLRGQIPFYTEDPVANPLTFPAQGDAAIGIIMGTNWAIELDNAANKKFVASFVAKYKREPATFAALGYDAIKLIDGAVRDVNGKIEDKDAVRAALRKANFESVRGSFKFNNNHYPDPGPLHHGGEEGRQGRAQGSAAGHGDQGLAGPLSSGMPDEVVRLEHARDRNCWAC